MSDFSPFIEKIYYFFPNSTPSPYNLDMNVKAALAIQGGGIRGVYASGAIDYLMEKQIEFSYVIGTSCGALNGTDYLSGDIGRTRDIMLEFMKDPKFFSFSNAIFKGSFFDFNYLVNVVPKTLPFNLKRFEDSEKTFYCVTTCLEDGKVHYFEHKEPDFIQKAVAASSSLPIVTPKPIEIDGKHYLDGGTVESLPFHKPIEEGFEKIVVIATRPKGYRKVPLKASRLAIVDLLYVKYPEYRKADKAWVETYNQHMDELDALSDSGRLFVLYPSKPLHVKTSEKNPTKIQEVYDLGYQDMKVQFEALMTYLKDAHE